MTLQALREGTSDLGDGAQVTYVPHHLSEPRAKAAFAALRTQIPWEQGRVKVFGREWDEPRLSCWHASPEQAYVYSQRRREPRPFPALLAALRDELVTTLAHPFDTVLANLYRDGADRMGLHADDEPCFGPQPTIASLSLGGFRRFVLRHRLDAQRRFGIDLAPGSLLVMSGTCQEIYRHGLPATARPVAPRINLTFRWFRGPGESPTL